MYGSGGNESGYSESLRTLDANLPMIGTESGYAKASGGGQQKCKCEGVKSNDGFGNPTVLYSFACCKKAV